MAYQVLRRHKHPFFHSDGGTREGCAPEATRRGNRKTAQEAAEEAPACTNMPYGVVTATGKVTQSPQRLVGGLDKCAALAPQGRGIEFAVLALPAAGQAVPQAIAPREIISVPAAFIAGVEGALI